MVRLCPLRLATFDLFLRRLAVFRFMASSPSYIPYLCVAAAAFITTFLTVPLVKCLAIKLDAVDYPSKRRINTKPIPRLGGTAVFLGLVVACIVQILGTWYLGWPPVLVPHPVCTSATPYLRFLYRHLCDRRYRRRLPAQAQAKAGRTGPRRAYRLYRRPTDRRHRQPVCPRRDHARMARLPHHRDLSGGIHQHH